MGKSNPILVRTAEAGKTYSFRSDHDPAQIADHWFQESDQGETLFLVFYTQACRWAQCLGCNLPSLMSPDPVGFADIMRQADQVFVRLLSDAQKRELRKIIVSNNGSVLDERTFSTTALIYLVALMNIHCPRVAVLTLETRPEYVDLSELDVLARALKEGETPTTLELAVGFEAFDETVRNTHFCKGLTLAAFEKMAENCARHRFHLKVYFMQKPVPEMSDAEAIEDVRRGIAYLDSVARSHDLRINLHLNPTYVARGTALETAFRAGRFSPPRLQDVMTAVLHARDTVLSVYVGLHDEGMAVDGGSFVRPGDEAAVRSLAEFNRTQDYRLIGG